MQLLGIYIMGEQEGITKILHRGWYPFGNYKKPALGKKVKVVDDEGSLAAKSIYQREGLPEISVNCIVGMNGSGKSTLLDIFYRMINNFSFRMLGEKRAKSTGRELKYARGVNADLFFVCEGAQYKLSCRDIRTTLYKNESGDTFTLVSVKDIDDPKSILRGFFYTISTNYSLYAFNEEEYIPDGIVANINSGVNGDWLKGLFHKNDGYYTPIVITPFRDHGNIDVDRENKLAEQRVLVLSLLSKSQGNNLFVKFDPHTIDYKIDLNYKERKESQFRIDIFQRYKNLDISHVLRSFELAWLKYFDSVFPQTDISESTLEQHELALFYLAYKTVKICFNYEDYKKTLNVDALIAAAEKGNLEVYARKKLPSKTDSVIQKLLEEIQDEGRGRSHITLKLSVCLSYMHNIYRHVVRWGLQDTKSVDDLVRGRNIRTYDDAVMALPPAFYTVVLKFKPIDTIQLPADSSWGGFGTLTEDGEFTINKMSSGERQMLYSLSYVLYHIKNIQSVREDDNRVAYHNICLIFDEAELYYHPDYQRRFLGMLLEAISWCNINPNIIHSIQILIVTHSPFILTDILTQNTLYLDNGNVQRVSQQTFGGNYYDLLNKSFFFEKSAIGDVAGRTLTNRKSHLSNHTGCQHPESWVITS